MATNTIALQPVTTRGWRMGLANMLGKEFGQWFKTRSWLVQAIIFTMIADGFVVMLRLQADAMGGQDLRAVAGMLFILFGGTAPAVGAAIGMQDEIIGEKQAGTAAWVLSKPLSRVAFVVSKLIADSLGFLVSGVLIPCIVAYVIFLFFPGDQFLIANFAAMTGLLYLNVLFYLTLTLMLGTVFSSRGPVIGIPLGLIFGYQIVLQVAPALQNVMPYWLVNPLGQPQTSLAAAVLTGQPLPSVTPIIGSAVGVVIFIVIALWRFRREEF